MITQDAIERYEIGFKKYALELHEKYARIPTLHETIMFFTQWAKKENERETLNGHLCSECAHTGKAQSQEPCNTCYVVDDKWEPKQ
jgi:hypothetical protein